MAAKTKDIEPGVVDRPDGWHRLMPSVAFCLCLLGIVTILIPSLPLSPTVWQDEVQILDYGRVLLNPSTDWSLTLDKHGDPRLLRWPLYVLVQQGWLQVVGTSPLTVRLLSLLSLVGASVAFWALLRTYGVRQWLAIVLALAFACDPLLVRSAAGARADSFTIMLSLTSVWAWRMALMRDSALLAGIAGLMAVSAVLAWPTAVVTLLLGVVSYGEHLWCTRRFSPTCVLVAISGALIAILTYYGLMQAFGLWERTWMSSLGSPTTSASSSSVRWFPRIQSLPKYPFVFLRSYLRSPWVLAWTVAAVGMLFWRRSDRGLVIALCGALAVTLYTPYFYTWRVMYIAPFLYLTIAVAMKDTVRPWMLIGLLLLPSFAINVAGRTGVAWAERQRRDYEAFNADLSSLIPREATVFGPWSHYYIGRDMGWKMYPLQGLEKRREFHDLDDVFFLIGNPGDLSTELRNGYQFTLVGKARSEGESLLPTTAASYHADVYRCESQGRAGDALFSEDGPS